jgi:hypothetical protein
MPWLVAAWLEGAPGESPMLIYLNMGSITPNLSPFFWHAEKGNKEETLMLATGTLGMALNLSTYLPYFDKRWHGRTSQTNAHISYLVGTMWSHGNNAMFRSNYWVFIEINVLHWLIRCISVEIYQQHNVAPF